MRCRLPAARGSPKNKKMTARESVVACIFLSTGRLFDSSAAERQENYAVSSLNNCGADDVIEPRKVALEISVAAFEERALFTGPDAAASRFAILGVELVRHVHAFDNTAERRKRLRVMRR